MEQSGKRCKAKYRNGLIFVLALTSGIVPASLAQSTEAAPAQSATPPASKTTGTGGGQLTAASATVTTAARPVQPAKPAKSPAPSTPHGGSGGGSFGQSPAPSTTPASAPPQAALKPLSFESTPPANEVAEAESPAKPGQAGIKVHGHWVLQIEHPDGTPGERREFENSISVFGGPYLAAVISGAATPADWVVALNGTNAAFALIPNDGWVGTWSTVKQEGGQTLQFAATQTGLNEVANVASGNIVLSGGFLNNASYGLTSIASVTAWAMVVDKVGSSLLQNNLQFSASTDSPAGAVLRQGNGDGYYEYGSVTNTAVPGGTLAVYPGETVMVTVTISFS